VNDVLKKMDASEDGPGVEIQPFGDLCRRDAVQRPHMDCMQPHRELHDMVVHLTVTGRCNARCQGCVNTALTFESGRGTVVQEFESVPERDAILVSLLAQRAKGSAVTVALYGGEPLLEPERILHLMDGITASVSSRGVRFMLYTNGQLLDRVVASHPTIFRDVFLVSVSVDGQAEQHARHRPGTDVQTIQLGLERLRTVYEGEVLFWSTLREEQSLTDCFRQFERFHSMGLASQMFWHWVDSPKPYVNFGQYARRYAAELTEIMDVYVDDLRAGRILPLCHVNELVLYLLEGTRRGHSACAVELAENFDIVGGRVTACADLPLSIGQIPVGEQDPIDPDLGHLVEYREVLGCDECGVDFYCGGRCPVQVLAGSPERTRQICQLMRLHVGIVGRRLGDIVAAMVANGLRTQDMYDRSACITRYTDVLP